MINNFHADGPSLRVYEIIVTVALIPYVCIRDLKMLAPFSAFANILTITGKFVCVICDRAVDLATLVRREFEQSLVLTLVSV